MSLSCMVLAEHVLIPATTSFLHTTVFVCCWETDLMTHTSVSDTSVKSYEWVWNVSSELVGRIRKQFCWNWEVRFTNFSFVIPNTSSSWATFHKSATSMTISVGTLKQSQVFTATGNQKMLSQERRRNEDQTYLVAGHFGKWNGFILSNSCLALFAHDCQVLTIVWCNLEGEDHEEDNTGSFKRNHVRAEFHEPLAKETRTRFGSKRRP